MAPARGLGRAGSEDVGAHRDAVIEWLEALDPRNDNWETELSPVAMTVVDALLHADVETLKELTEPLRDALARLFDDAGHAREIRGYLIGTLEAARWGLQRLPDSADVDLAPDTHTGQMLAALAADEPLTGSELRERLATSDSQLSRVGRHLLARGLVVQRRAGRAAVWELSARGRQALRESGDRRDRRAR
jgi:hypothetical protein